MSEEKQQPKSPWYEPYIKLFTATIKEVGITGFIVIVLTIIFFAFSTLEQKREFIDRFFLLKNPDGDHFHCIFVVVILMAIIILGGIYSIRTLRERRRENNRIGKEKSELQQKLLNMNLNSSDE